MRTLGVTQNKPCLDLYKHRVAARQKVDAMQQLVPVRALLYRCDMHVRMCNLCKSFDANSVTSFLTYATGAT